MAEFVFTSPGVKFRERDLTYVTRTAGITTLGLVGETLKGPAFEPVYVQDKNEFTERFGVQSIERFSDGKLKYQLPYVANTYLEESNQLWVTRVLGLSGYDAGDAWAITIGAGIDPTTVATGSTTIQTGVTFTNNTYLGVTLNSLNDTGVYFSGYTKTNDTEFEGYSQSFTATTVNQDGTGKVTVATTFLSGTSYSEYENMVVAVIRSRGYVVDVANSTPQTIFNTSTLTLTGNTTTLSTGDLFGQFVLKATNTASTESYTVSLNPNSSSFIPNVIGSLPKDKNTKIWVHSIYPDLLKKLDAEGYAHSVKRIVKCNTTHFTDFKQSFKTPETPWVVSQLKGSVVDRLFKFISISDGDSANQEIKITIGNINPATYEFDVVVRNFYDTDDNPIVLESFTKCSMIKGSTGYIAQRIGTTDGEYDLMSKYIMVELNPDISEVYDLFPAGFEGYLFNEYSGITGGTKAPKIFYKTSYSDTDKVKKTYLGISEKAYTSISGDIAGIGINQNFYNYVGLNPTHKSDGFHMDSGATSTYNGYTFQTGEGDFNSVDDVLDTDNPYYDVNRRKFTFVPYGGFDGWNVHRTNRSYGDLYRLGGIYDGVANVNIPATNDFQAWETAINTFSNPEEVTINLFATPGINWSDNNIIVKDTIDMIEDQRTDTLYVIDCPDVNVTVSVGDSGKADVLAANDIVDLLDNAEIDSNYACTYFPYIQIRDTQNNVNVYIPPTGEVVKAMAYTDNVKFPWFAPAGLTRGVTNARKSKYKLSLEARDILYSGRINPMADFSDVGTAIFGQKTLQVKESALNAINVRRLLLQIKVLISNISLRLIFDQNDQAVIDQFLQKTNPILDNIKRERGLIDFRIKMDSSNNTTETLDRNELYGEIFLKPTRSLEKIGITFTITPSGASFTDVGA